LRLTSNRTRLKLLPGGHGPGEKLAQVYDEKGRRRAQNRDAELTKLQARSGQLMVNAIVWRKPSIDAPLRAVAQIGAGMVAGMVAIPAPAAFS